MRCSTTPSITWRRFSCIAALCLSVNAGAVRAQEVFACVWRNPERTMTRLFPDAVDYRTVTRRISPEQRAALEKQLGFKLLPGQQDQFQYFELLGAGGKKLGHVIAASQKGEFGAIEFVFGLDPSGAVVNLYVQRARERDVAFKEREFLDSFTGVSMSGFAKLAKRAGEEKNVGRRVVIQGVMKELAAMEMLGK